MRFRNLSVDWKCPQCGKQGNLYIAGGVGLPWHHVRSQLVMEHHERSRNCNAAFDEIKFSFSRLEDKHMASTGQPPPLDFHIYIRDGSVTVVMDEHDPQREELMRNMAQVFNGHDRTREADECLGIGIKG